MAADDQALARRHVAGRGGAMAGHLPDDVVDLLAVQRLALEQVPGDAVEDLAVLAEDRGGALVGGRDDLDDLAVDADRRVLAVVGALGELAAEEDRLVL